MSQPSSLGDPRPQAGSLRQLLREFHSKIPLAGDPPNSLLGLPDDQLDYLAAAIRNSPWPAPALTDAEWDHFFDLLRPHWILPLIAYHVRTWPDDSRPPAEKMEILNRIYLNATARSWRAGHQIRQVMDAMQKAGIPALLIKGHAFARTIYPCPALRQSSDIDILVRPQDIPEAEEILEKIGYECPSKTFQVSQKTCHHDTFITKSYGLRIELHWMADNACNLFPKTWMDDVFSRKVKLVSEDFTCFTLSPSDHLLYHVFHQVIQHWSMRLDWIYDVARLSYFSQPDLDWRHLVKQSVELHIRIPLELSLTASCLWTGLTPPSAAGDSSVWPVPRDKEREILKYTPTQNTHLYSSFRIFLQGQPGINNKMRFIWRFIFPPAPTMILYRHSSSKIDLLLAYFRRWFGIRRYL